MHESSDWFKVWFDSPYYHLLYRHRDRSEAGRFISNLVNELELPKGSKILDMGCGKGRHCIMLNELGFDVVGIDLSESNIAAASSYNRPDLQFIRHDMRVPLRGLEFDLVLNLFTSFGYFKTHSENLEVLKAANSVLKSGGRFVLDFLNSTKALQELVPHETKEIEKTHFDIRRSVEDGIIVKRIEVNHNPEVRFEERVQALLLDDLLQLFEQAGLKPLATYGSYDFKPFDEETSGRLIIIAEKE